jgi:hypothetical protein
MYALYSALCGWLPRAFAQREGLEMRDTCIPGRPTAAAGDACACSRANCPKFASLITAPPSNEKGTRILVSLRQPAGLQLPAILLVDRAVTSRWRCELVTCAYGRACRRSLARAQRQRARPCGEDDQREDDCSRRPESSDKCRNHQEEAVQKPEWYAVHNSGLAMTTGALY